MQLLSSSTAGWRSVWQVHSAVDLFPALAPDQLTDLAEDIRKNGLLHPVIYCKKPDGTHILIDGRSRLDALELLGLLKITNGQMTIDGMADGTWKREDPDAAADPIAYVISANIRRRHLDRDQRRSVLEQLIETDPTKSARQVARLAGVSPTTAVAVRDALVLRGDVSKLDTSTDSLGRQQPTHKVKAKMARASPPSRFLTPNSSRRSPGSCERDQIASALHAFAAKCLDVEPQSFLSSYSETKRIDILGSARIARNWLDTLLNHKAGGRTDG